NWSGLRFPVPTVGPWPTCAACGTGQHSDWLLAAVSVVAAAGTGLRLSFRRLEGRLARAKGVVRALGQEHQRGVGFRFLVPQSLPIGRSEQALPLQQG